MSSATTDALAEAIVDRQDRREPYERVTNQLQVAETLQDADEPLTMRQLRLEAHPLSEPQIRRLLNGLVDIGVVERVPHPDDGRVPRYQLAELSPEADHDRGQITPVGAGVLMLAVGLLLLAAITIGVIA